MNVSGGCLQLESFQPMTRDRGAGLVGSREIITKQIRSLGLTKKQGVNSRSSGFSSWSLSKLPLWATICLDQLQASSATFFGIEVTAFIGKHLLAKGCKGMVNRKLFLVELHFSLFVSHLCCWIHMNRPYLPYLPYLNVVAILQVPLFDVLVSWYNHGIPQ